MHFNPFPFLELHQFFSEIEEKYAEEIKSSLSNQIRSQLEEEVLAALELEVEEKLKEKVLQDLETERQTLEDAKNQFQQEVRLFKPENHLLHRKVRCVFSMVFSADFRLG